MDAYVFTGGEPGLLPSEHMDYIFSFSDKQIDINTNGTWLYKNEHYIQKAKRIVYHQLIELQSQYTLDKYEQYSNIFYAFMIHHDNISKLDNFLVNLINIDINRIIFYFYDNKKNQDDNKTLSLSDMQEIYNVIGKYMPSHSILKYIRYILTYPNLIPLYRNICNKYCIFPAIDLVNETIKNCPNSYSNAPYLELTEKNLNLLLDNKLFTFEHKNPLCDTCFSFLFKFDKITDLYLMGSK